MTHEELGRRYDLRTGLNDAMNASDDNTSVIEGERRSVKDIISLFERSSIIEEDHDDEDVVVRRQNLTPCNLTKHHYHYLHTSSNHQDRNSGVSINSILSAASEDSYESGFVSDRKSGTDFCEHPKPTRVAPRPPVQINDDSSSASSSAYENDDNRSSRFKSQSVSRRVKPPVIRRKSFTNQALAEQSLWTYGIQEKDLRQLPVYKKLQDNANREPIYLETLENKGGNCETTTVSPTPNNLFKNKSLFKERTSSNEEDTVTETVSIDQSSDTLKNENEEVSDFDTSTSDDHSSYDNVSIKSISSFDNMVPYVRYDSCTVSSDEYGTEVCHDPETEFLTVSAVNECCISKLSNSKSTSIEPKKEKHRRQLNERMNELRQTERAYVNRLHHVVRHYMPEMSRPDLPASLQDLDFDVIFSNIELLYRFHSKQFLPALMECENDLVKLGHCFKRFEDQFNMYVDYSRYNKRATRLVYEHKKFFQEKQDELGDRLDLSSFLLEPVQRIPRYKLFIDDLIKTYNSYEKSDESRERKKSVDKNETGLNNDNGSDDEKTNVDGQYSYFKDCPVTPKQRGQLIHHDDFWVTDSRGTRLYMHVFLYERAVILTSAGNRDGIMTTFSYEDHIYIDELGITTNDHNSTKFSIWLGKHDSKHFKLESKHANIKNLWTGRIKELLWKQAIEKKETLLKNRNSSDSADYVKDVPGEPTSFEVTIGSLRCAKTMVEDLLNAIDGIIALENITDSPIDVMQMGRFIRQNEFDVMDNTRRRRHHMRVFLFEYVLLLTNIYRKELTVEVFVYRDHIPMDHLGITAREHHHNKFTIWYDKPNQRPYKLETRDPEIRRVWVEDISKLLWNQIEQKKELVIRNRNARVSVILSGSQNSTYSDDEWNDNKYNSLRGVPGELRHSERSDRTTTWYFDG